MCFMRSGQLASEHGILPEEEASHLLLVPQGQPGLQIRRSCQRMLFEKALCAL